MKLCQSYKGNIFVIYKARTTQSMYLSGIIFCNIHCYTKLLCTAGSRVIFPLFNWSMGCNLAVHLPANTKHLYHINTMLERCCINVIQMFCVCWAVNAELLG